MRLNILYTFIFYCLHVSAFAQGVGINAAGTPAHGSAMLDVSSTTQGALFPRMNTGQMNDIDTPATGLMIFNTDCNNFNYYNGTAWEAVNTSNSHVPTAPGNITGATTACAGATGTYSISAVSGANYYTWTVPPGAAINSGQGTTSVSVTFGNTSGNIGVTQSNNCGTSTQSLSAITINSAPATPGAITGLITAIPGQAGTTAYSVSPVANATTYNWTLPSGVTLSSGSGTNSILATFTCNAVTGNVSVTAQGTCGTSSASTLTVTESNLIASAGSNVNSNICPNVSTIGGSPTASGGNASSYTYSWSSPSTLSSATVANPTPSCTNSSVTYTVTVTDANTCTATSSMIFTFGETASPTTLTLNYTGSSLDWIVPAGVSSVSVDLAGAQGGSGGNGGRVQTTLAVTAGQTLNINVGGHVASQWAGSGFNGGGGGSYGGGGASDIRQGGSGLGSRVIVGGGGGGTGGYGGAGGAGGNPTGGAGGDGCSGIGGGGGTQSAGGAGYNSGYGAGTPGAAGTGGNGSYYGGGGGGGYYGGGGGGAGNCCSCSGGGGGGSSYAGAGTSATTFTTGYRSGYGYVLITW